GTSFVSNPRLAGTLAPALLGPDAARYETPRLFTARGLATKLADAYVVQLTSNYAAAGFLQAGTRTVKTSTETWTRTDFTNDEGRAMVLFVSKRTDGVYFLTAAGR
ncbi:hypothetical protein, partial [Deinococcus pimensis]|uniref:hypothetical protein n=1 Tax=Deinococcus pimensis TaxID=309888 RepID=UPI001B7F7E0C